MKLENNIPQYFQYSEKLSSGGQPSDESLNLLKNEGFQMVINLSPVSAKNYLPSESYVLEKLGIDYIHYPIDCSNLRSSHYQVFKALLDIHKGKRIFVHCGANIKSSNLIHMYQVLSEKTPEKTSLQQLMKIQNPEPKWILFFKQNGMKGE